MQIQLITENIENEDFLQNLNIESIDSSFICLSSSLSISSWIVDYYFTKVYSNQTKLTNNKYLQPNNIIGSYDMFLIYQKIQSSSSLEFSQLCKNKIKQIKNNSILDDYNNYLNRCGLIDIIDLFHHLNIETLLNKIILSINNIKCDIDRLMIQYLIELSSSSCYIYDIKTKSLIKETNENLLKLIEHQKLIIEATNSKNSIKYALCTYLSLLLDTRNEHALMYCLVTPKSHLIQEEILTDLTFLSKSSKNESLTKYQILLSFLRRKELTLNRRTTSQHELSNNDDKSFSVLDKYFKGIKEFFDFIEKLQTIIEENEHLKIESNKTFRKILLIISKQLCKDALFRENDLIINQTIEELCQCFHQIHPLITCTSPIQSSSSESTFTGYHFHGSIAYLCAKNSIDLSTFIDKNSVNTFIEDKQISTLHESALIKQQEINNQTEQFLPSKSQNKHLKTYRSFDLSTIHETSFESDSVIHNKTDHIVTSDSKVQVESTRKRQPLQEFDVNSFNDEERKTENEKNSPQNSTVLKLPSDTDQENLPITLKKRSIALPMNEPPKKRHKKANVKRSVSGQQTITNFFQSID